ncbi:formate--tetrahydrofolate ligase [Phaeodactylibacter luteus]|uniref:Formate--tetrahydrofolate ligase n=1 Tax=Phaeodactylibacter luteus TaxID=1564516 RepID=A0A5C6S783_9BACT|nr:formate--tetrahydrofolate ligase [Phaeodactylibacter luteus]TXB70259.1 formate--tetrahydrofolate ligase [Phaeodactylibacter luteus]
MNHDIQIARAAQLEDIGQIASRLGLSEDDLERYGKYKAKLPLRLIRREGPQGKLILVTAISPTPAGEGKTTVSIGLSQGLNHLGRKVAVVLREPSLGPVFGIKGGAAGGGQSQVLPMEDINLHFTGDFSAIEKAHNLLAALIDNNLQSKSRSLGIDPRTVLWKRVMDMNDRALRHTVIGLGGTGGGMPRESGFDITAASEIMAILCLSESLSGLKERLGNIFVGFTFDKKPVYARDLHAQGAMAALLRDAIKPNLVQAIEGVPAIIHGGPFANIAQGTNSVLATRMGLSLADYVVTEAGFGADLGAEKFLDIKCQSAGLAPDAAVLVATIRALKYHGGVALPDLGQPNPEAVANGLPNLEKHLDNLRGFGLNAVVALNRFGADTEAEIQVVAEACRKYGVRFAISEAWGKGGNGAAGLAEQVLAAANEGSHFKPLYEWETPLKSKIERIAQRIYGAEGVVYSKRAERDLKRAERLGLSDLPICMAKTQKSLSDDPSLIGRPTGFDIHIREVEIAAGAGFIIPISGDIMRMPGLPATPSAEQIDINEEGEITGLF